MKTRYQTLLAASVFLLPIMASCATAQTPTVRVPQCLQMQNGTKYYVPCTGVVPINTETGNAMRWDDLFAQIANGGGGLVVDAGSGSSKATPIQNADGTKLATKDQLTDVVTQLSNVVTKLTALNTSVGTPLQAGGTIGGFTSTPTVNIGTMPAQTISLPSGAATDSTLAQIVTKLNDLITSVKATLVTNTTVPAIGSPTDAAATTTDATATTLIAQAKQLVKKLGDLTAAVGTPLQAGSTVATTQSGTWTVGISGPVTLANSGINLSGSTGNALKQGTGAATADSMNVVIGGQASPLTVTSSLATGSNVIGSIANTGFNVTGTLPAFATTPTVNLGTLNGVATDATLTTIKTALGTPFQSGGTIGNSAFGISGTLPAFAATPTFNLGTAPTLTVAGTVTANLGTVAGLATDTSVNTLFKAGQSVGNTFFGARLQDSTGAAFGTSANPIYVSGGGGGGGGSTPTGTAGAANVNVVTVQGISGGTPLVVTGTGTLSVQNTAPLAAGSNAIGSITNTAFGISGTLPAFASTPTVNIGTAPTLNVSTLGTVSTAAPTYANGAVAALSLTPSGALRVDTGSSGSAGTVTANIGTTGGLALDTTTNSLFKSGQSIGNTAFGISGTLPAFATTPTFNLGTAPTLTVNNLATVATSAPTYTNGSNASLSLTTAGALRVDTGGTTQTVNGTVSLGGTLPAFASVPTVNVGALPAITVSASALPTNAATSSLQLALSNAVGNATDAAATTTDVTATTLIAQTKQLVNRVNSLITTLGSPVQANTALSSVVQATATDRGQAAVGTTAVQLMPANATRKGMSLQVQSTTASCYINGQTQATADYHSLLVGPGGYFEPDHHIGTGAISIICTAANTPVFARDW